MFRVPWVDDKGEVQVNRGFRVEMNSAIGPYKGGLRFHPTVNLGMLKFLAFEQVFKNSLTTLPMGGGKGGSDFDPKGKSDNEVMRFCQAFMTELTATSARTPTCPPATSAWAAARSATCSASTRSCANAFDGVLTGKGLELGRLADPSRGHRLRRGLFRRGDAGHPRRQRSRARPCLVSGSGNVAQYTVEKVNAAGRQGRHAVRLATARSTTRTGIDAREAGLRHGPEERPPRPHQRVRREVQGRAVPRPRQAAPGASSATWPSPARRRTRSTATDAADAASRTAACASPKAPTCRPTPEGVDVFLEAKILYGPGKAANAGGVATSGLEMAQNSLRLNWTARRSRHPPARHHEGHPQDSASKPPASTARPSTTSTAPTSPASSRSPTPCSTRASSEPDAGASGDGARRRPRAARRRKSGGAGSFTGARPAALSPYGRAAPGCRTGRPGAAPTWPFRQGRRFRRAARSLSAKLRPTRFSAFLARG